MRLYTRTGDGGETSLLGGERVGKDTLRVELLGSLDEVSAAVGLAVAFLSPRDEVATLCRRIQRELFILGAEVADRSQSGGNWLPRLGEAHVRALEADIDTLSAAVPPLRAFILPGGTPAGAALHLARAVCRRAERIAVRVQRDEPLPPHLTAYLNRLSDLLFVAARKVNHEAGCAEPLAKGSAP